MLSIVRTIQVAVYIYTEPYLVWHYGSRIIELPCWYNVYFTVGPLFQNPKQNTESNSQTVWRFRQLKYNKENSTLKQTFDKAASQLGDLLPDK